MPSVGLLTRMGLGEEEEAYTSLLVSLAVNMVYYQEKREKGEQERKEIGRF